MSEIRWEEPPAARPSPSEFDDTWRPILDQLVGRPGEWGMIYESDAPSTAYNKAVRLRKRYGTKGKFEFLARTISTENGKSGRVYARHLPHGGGVGTA